jgi:hypothetical protein
MSFICETCKSSFKSRSNLNGHIKTAKYCIKMRAVPITSFSCDICSHTFTSKYNLQLHYASCSSHPGYVKYKDLYTQTHAKYQANEEAQNKQILLLQQLLESKDRQLQELSLEAVKRPSTITNNNTNNNTNNISIKNLAVFNPLAVVEQIERYPITAEIFDGGLVAIGKHIGDSISQFGPSPPYAVTDKSRKTFAFKDENGNIRKEKDASTLINTVGPTLVIQAKPIKDRRLQNFEYAQRYKKLKDSEIPNYRKFIRDLEDQLKDLPCSRNRESLENKIKEYDDQLKIYIEELEEITDHARCNNIDFDLPMDEHAKNLQKTVKNFNSIQHLKKEPNCAKLCIGLVKSLPV